MTSEDNERSTADAVAPTQLRADVSRLMAVLAEGGVALAPLDVAYAILAMRESGIRRIFAAKRRSYDKPSGMFGSAVLSAELHDMPADRHAMVAELVAEEDFPFSVVAPFHADHPLLQTVDPFVLASSSKAGTLDMLINAGQFHDEIARQVRETGRPVFGSSANLSLSGSKYRLRDIDAEVREAADIEFDYGTSRYANDAGRSSTIIDFRDFHVVRVGVCFDRVEAAFATRFAVTLKV